MVSNVQYNTCNYNFIGKACQILQKHNQPISETHEIVHLMCNEGIIPHEISNSEMTSSLIFSKLHSAVYEDHYKLKKFGLILQKFEHTIQLGTDIVNDYGKKSY